MPQMTGLQLAEAIKKEWPDLPVMLATGFAEMEQEMRSSLPKLSKPFTEAELAEELELSFQERARRTRAEVSNRGGF